MDSRVIENQGALRPPFHLTSFADHISPEDGDQRYGLGENAGFYVDEYRLSPHKPTPQ